VEEDLIPDDVTIQVLTQAREHIIAGDYTQWKANLLPELDKRV